MKPVVPFERISLCLQCNFAAQMNVSGLFLPRSTRVCFQRRPGGRLNSFRRVCETYQPRLSKVDRKALGSKAQELVRTKTISQTQIGKAGVTDNFIYQLGDSLAKNEIVKVRIGSGCYLNLDEIQKTIEDKTDSICVHSIGFTMTFYRQKGLPRPESSLRKVVPKAETVETEEEVEDEETEPEEEPSVVQKPSEYIVL